jgi:predicted phage terminase large subunit-like protein
MISKADAARELLARRAARKSLAKYIQYTNKDYKTSAFSESVCSALDVFVEDVIAGKRPILILAAPPQHGKTEIVSRKFASYLIGKFPDWHVGGLSYNDLLAGSISQDVRRNIASDKHRRLFPSNREKNKYDVNRTSEFNSPSGRGTYKGAGIGAGLTGFPLSIGIIDDPIKNAEESLSEVTKEGIWSWYQSVFKTRLSEFSGQLIMATRWAEDDLTQRVIDLHKGESRLKTLFFPAINEPGEVGYNPALPLGALVPDLHSLAQLGELKRETSDYFWAALYQQCPKPLGGNVFKESGIHYYLPKDLPKKFDKIINSWDCTFKDTDGTDFVVGQAWGKSGANSYLLGQTRARMSFTKTVEEVVSLRDAFPSTREILIEDKANGPAVIDVLKAHVPCLIPIEPDGSKLARAHAVTSFWEAGNVFLPHPDIAAWVKNYVSELTVFPAGANDDQVDATTQALRRLYPVFVSLKISKDLLDRAKRLKPR